jgi:hypothetical protein
MTVSFCEGERTTAAEVVAGMVCIVLNSYLLEGYLILKGSESVREFFVNARQRRRGWTFRSMLCEAFSRGGR